MMVDGWRMIVIDKRDKTRDDDPESGLGHLTASAVDILRVRTE